MTNLYKMYPMALFETHFDDVKAGWYAHYSPYPEDIRPAWSSPTQGICNFVSYEIALNRCIEYTKKIIKDAEEHLVELENARKEYLKEN